MLLRGKIFKRRCSPFYGVTAQNPIEDGLLKSFENARLKAVVLILNLMLNMPSN